MGTDWRRNGLTCLCAEDRSFANGLQPYQPTENGNNNVSISVTFLKVIAIFPVTRSSDTLEATKQIN